MLSVSLFNANQHRQLNLDRDVLYVGSGSAETWNDLAVDDSCFQVIDPRVPPRQMSLRGLGSGQAELNVWGASIALSSGARIHAGQCRVLDLPVSFCVGDTQVQILDANATHELDFGLTSMSAGVDATDNQISHRANSPGPATLAAWLEALSRLQRVVAGSDELFQLAARAVFNPGGLDGSLILVPSQGGWKIAASHIPYPDHGIGFREDLVKRAEACRSTVYHQANLNDDQSITHQLHTAVVCPILDETGQCNGVVYGFRSLHRRNNRSGIRYLEAQFVQVVADALSAAMFRLEAEANAARSKVLLEQAFAPSIARQLHANQKVLEAANREVTVLFADLRGFSEISERIGTHDTYELLSDVMDRFSSIINDFDGVIIDYYGDGVSAFWNAPLDQDQHAILACQTGLEMIDAMSELNQVWSEKIESELKIGIGIHTGYARVGNSGSRTRLKYGPRGPTINLASRLESLTKQWNVPLLISGETAAQVECAFKTSYVETTTLRGFSSSTEVFRLSRKSQPSEHGDPVAPPGHAGLDFDAKYESQQGRSIDGTGLNVDTQPLD